ncbi:MAG: L,D-transpeptidase [Saprospiraceae bacterium]|nr:L,D-transpeptidase [Saprospiraceae bacterium]
MKNIPQNDIGILAFGVLLALIFSCQNKAETHAQIEVEPVAATQDTLPTPPPPPFDTVVLTYDVTIGCLFDFLDTLVKRYDTLAPYPVSEHLLVRANPWLIDSLENTDYYRLKERGIFNYDNRSLVVMQEGDTLFIPNEADALELLTKMDSTVIDINIPEFKLRIVENGDTIYTFPCESGRTASATSSPPIG